MQAVAYSVLSSGWCRTLQKFPTNFSENMEIEEQQAVAVKRTPA
jgi:hypothetical protein